MKNWMTYDRVQELKRKGFSKSKTAQKLKMDFKTVAKYWDMSAEEYAIRSKSAKARKKKADKYKVFVIDTLRDNPDMTAAQLYDWIRENFRQEYLPFQERAFRYYVSKIREEYEIPKPSRQRQYEAVDELAPGEQAQVDMGEIYVKTKSGRRKKIYCFGMVLSHSRYKFIVWQTRPWTTADFVKAHIQAFSFFDGRPREIVYDQDKVLTVSENHGDIIYTEGFQNYHNSVGFSIRLCFGADPESKGKIEAVVKYAKYGFADHRTLTDIDSFNDDCIQWLNRTGNRNRHGTTKKIPAEEFAFEREYLLPVSEYSFAKPVDASITYQVRKDNIVVYKGNRYRVPKGTYSEGKRVFMIVDEEMVSIVDAKTGVQYAKHPLATGKGELIGSSSRSEESKSASILELEQSTALLFDDNEEITRFLIHVHHDRKRYYRDQLHVIRRLFDVWDADIINKALSYCVTHELYSAGDLKTAVAYFSCTEMDRQHESVGSIRLPDKYMGDAPETRDLKDYERAMNRGCVNG